METLNLRTPSPIEHQAPLLIPPDKGKKNAGLAWALSFVCPGAGQLYCGFQGRGAITLALFWSATLVTLTTKPPAAIWGVALRYAMALWCFATLDAFFSAIEINSGMAPLMEGANPRVAAILNLLTKGWGYFYLGKKREGIAVFIALMAFDGVSRNLKGRPFLWTSAIAEVVMICLCVHAYRLGWQQLRSTLPAAAATTDSERFPVGLPLVLAGFVAANYFLLVVLGLMLPNYKPIDESHATIQPTKAATLYRNPKYGISVDFPVSWELSYPTHNEFVMGMRPGGGCVVQFMAAPELPVVSRQGHIRDLTRMLTGKGYIYEQQRSSHLGNLSASEVTFRHKQGENAELDQAYLFAKKGLSSYILITTMRQDVRSKCEELSEQIRSSVRIQ